MANFFEQFDNQEQQPAQPVQSAQQNFFAQFDEPAATATAAPKQIDQPAPEKGFFESASDFVTGADRATQRAEAAREVGAAPALNEFSFAAATTGLGLLTATSNQEAEDILRKQYGDRVTFDTDEAGNRYARFDGDDEEFILNAPGLSQQDLAKFVFDAAAFTPAGRAAAGARGALSGAAIGAAGGGATAAGIEAVSAATGGQFDSENVGVEAALGGAFGALPGVIRGIRNITRQVSGKPPQSALIGERFDRAHKAPADGRFQSSYARPQLEKALTDVGLKFDDLTPGVVDRLRAVPEGTNPEQALRQALFEELDIPTTQSRISQEDIAFASERRLARDTASPEGQILRERFLEESAGFREQFETLITDLGLPQDAGDSIKDALTTLKTGDQQQVDDAYQYLASLPGSGIPVATQKIFDVLGEEASLLRRIGRDAPGDLKRIENRLAEFGIIRPEDVKSGAFPADQVTPLNINNFEEFRQSIVALFKPGDKEMNKIAGRLNSALDKEIDQLDNALKSGELGESGNISREVISAAIKARNLSKKYLTSFESKDIVQDLIKPKKGTFDTPFIDGSAVYNKLIKASNRSSTIEDLNRVMTQLERAGDKGTKAVHQLQSATIFDLMNKAFKGTEKEGVRTFSGPAFIKALEGIGDRELNRLFKNNKPVLNQLKLLEKAGSFTIAPRAVSKASGTADDLINFARRVPGLSQFLAGSSISGQVASAGVEQAGKALKGRAARKELKKVLSAEAERNIKGGFNYLYPYLASALRVDYKDKERE